MMNLPARKVGIISCSGEELAEGTVSQVATRLVLEKLRPGQTVTLCLPLFLVGGEEERAFAKLHPTITVDGCGKQCAAKATGAYSAKPAAMVVVSRLARRFSGLRVESRRSLGQGGMELARRVAEEIAALVDGILARQALAGVIPMDALCHSQAARLDSSPSRREGPTSGCLCGLDELPVKTVRVGDRPVGIAGLERIFERVLASPDAIADRDLKEGLLQMVKIYNYIPPGHEAAYAEAIWSEFVTYRAKGGRGGS